MADLRTPNLELLDSRPSWQARWRHLRDASMTILVAPVLLPLCLATAIAVWCGVGRPLLFWQERHGIGGRPFHIAKFRSMTDARDDDGNLLPDDQRLLPMGNLLRRFRLDELPAFLLVLRGDLALVGPRPLPTFAIVLHPLGNRRLAVLPGFTGLAQVSGGTLLSTAEKFALDCYYIRSRRAFTDFSILFATVRTIFVGERRDEPLLRRVRQELPEFFADEAQDPS